MLYSIGSPLPELRIKAAKCTGNTENRICDDSYARKYGFKAGLVPGATIYAHMARSLVEFSSVDWLKRGSAEVVFHHPAYDGDEIRIAGHLASISRSGTLQFEMRAENQQGMLCAAGIAGLPPHPPDPAPERARHPPGNAARRALTFETLQAGEHLRPAVSEFNRTTHWEYCEKTLRDHNQLFRELVHPGWLLMRVDALLAENYDLPAWIHVASAIQNFHAQQQECMVETRGTLVEKFESRGNHFLVLDAAIFADQRCLCTIRHTIIFTISPRVA
jgi:hypothetical protein